MLFKERKKNKYGLKCYVLFVRVKGNNIILNCIMILIELF